MTTRFDESGYKSVDPAIRMVDVSILELGSRYVEPYTTFGVEPSVRIPPWISEIQGGIRLGGVDFRKRPEVPVGATIRNRMLNPSKAQKRQALKLLNEFQAVFATSNLDLGEANFVEHTIEIVRRLNNTRTRPHLR